MTGPLAQQIAQVREMIGADDARAALSAIERHVQDMEKALREIVVVLTTGDEDGWRDPVGIARAALPAREKGTE